MWQPQILAWLYVEPMESTQASNGFSDLLFIQRGPPPLLPPFDLLQNVQFRRFLRLFVLQSARGEVNGGGYFSVMRPDS
jgi:hypothetical protein